MFVFLFDGDSRKKSFNTKISNLEKHYSLGLIKQIAMYFII